ncbi:ATP-dependent 6-phosphofructokinase 2-like [Iris pallida]|uniref:ATP-dependent 6-phosphofructokinase 2-like n=1 Tax=Iris pallida TaxID=29817 RepID=A0AAX6FF33_IRIPA|nr:ATP-dependent 6-phosphofructokinase 2-like [Iris pallida]
MRLHRRSLPSVDEEVLTSISAKRLSLSRHSRYSGFMPLSAAVMSIVALIPEMNFYLDGKGNLFEFLDQKLKQNGHAVIVDAEGAGQRIDAQKEDKDEPNNPDFFDVGPWLKSEFKRWWERDHKGELSAVKYIDHKWAWVRSVTNQPDFDKSSKRLCV